MLHPPRFRRPFFESLEERRVLTLNFDFVQQFSTASTANVNVAKMINDAAGNVVMTGQFRGTIDFDFGPGAATFNATSSSTTAADFFAKYTSAGDLLWVKTISNASFNSEADIARDSAGNLIFATKILSGGTENVDIDPGPGVELDSVSTTRIVVLKLDTNGNTIWTGPLAGGALGPAVAVDAEDNVLLTGQFVNTADLDPGPRTRQFTSVASTYDAYLLKIDGGDGNLLWADQIGSNGPSFNGEHGTDLVADSAGNIFLIGRFIGTVDFDPGPLVSNLTVIGGSGADTFFAKYDRDGGFVWAKALQGASSSFLVDAENILLDAQGNVVLAGSFQSTPDFDPGPGVFNLTASAGFFSPFYGKYSAATGDLMWVVSSQSQIVPYQVTLAANGDIISAGQFGATADFDPGTSAVTAVSQGSVDIYVARYTSEGVFKDVAAYGAAGLDRAKTVLFDSANNYVYITGLFNGTFDFDPGAGTASRTAVVGDSGFWQRLTAVDPTPAATVALANVVTSIPSTQSTAAAIPVADIVVTGANSANFTYSLAGPDAASFEIVGGQLRLKAGTTLNFATNPLLSTRILVDDPLTTTNPDAAIGYRLDIALATQYVSARAVTSGGVTFRVSKPAAIAALNLYDYVDAVGVSVLGPADVTLTGAVSGAIPGSLLIDADGDDFQFVATSGVLAPDTYTLTLRSAANAIQAASGGLLDGNANGADGDNFSLSFTVPAQAAGGVTLRAPNFARGPEQPVNVPADTTTGLPITVSNGNGLQFFSFEVRFDTGLLNVTGATLPAGAPAGSTISTTLLAPGRRRIDIAFSSALAAGLQTVANLTADVPTSAAARYGERGVVDLAIVRVHNSAGTFVPAIDADSVQVNTYFGDVGRNGRYDSFDVQQASRIAVRLDGGFQKHPLLDPVIVGDFNANNRIDSFDVQRISRLALRLPVTEAAALPPIVPVVTDTGRLTAPEEKENEKQVETPFHNAAPGLRSDIDGNGAVDPQDVLWAIYAFNRSEDGAIPEDSQALKVDVNGDNRLDPADILFAINDFGGTSQANDDLAALLANDAALARKKK